MYINDCGWAAADIGGKAVIDAICAEECWALPAHVDTNTKGWRETIDLFSSETAFPLDEIIRLLENKLSASVREKARGGFCSTKPAEYAP